MHEDEEDLPMRLGHRELLKVGNFCEISNRYSWKVQCEACLERN